MPAWLLSQTGRDRLLRPSGAMSWAIIAQKHCHGQRRENIIYQFGCFGVRSTVVYVTNPLTNYTLQRRRTTKTNNSNCLLESKQLPLFDFGGHYPHHLQDQVHTMYILCCNKNVGFSCLLQLLLGFLWCVLSTSFTQAYLEKGNSSNCLLGKLTVRSVCLVEVLSYFFRHNLQNQVHNLYILFCNKTRDKSMFLFRHVVSTTKENISNCLLECNQLLLYAFLFAKTFTNIIIFPFQGQDRL